MRVYVHFNHLKGNRAQEASRALSVKMLLLFLFFFFLFLIVFCFLFLFCFVGWLVGWLVGFFLSPALNRHTAIFSLDNSSCKKIDVSKSQKEKKKSHNRGRCHFGPITLCQ